MESKKDNKPNAIEKRILFWLVVWFVASASLVWWTVSQSQSNMENDPSSMAWTGFLPFFIPLFFIETGKYLLPVVIVVEAVLWWRKKNQ